MPQMHSAEQVRDYMLVYYTGLFCIVWYDWLVLFAEEYRKIWCAKWSLVKFFYLANRYSMLALTVVIWTGFGLHKSTSECIPLFAFQNAIPVLVYLFSGFILILRCYALYGRNKAVAGGLLLLHLLHVCVSGWAIKQVETIKFENDGNCIPRDTMIYHAFYVCFSAVIFDLVATVLCVWKSYSHKRQYTSAAVPAAVIDNIIRNGSIYIIGTMLAAFANMAFRFLSARNFATPMDGYAGGNLCVAINSILSARLCLSLKVDDQFSTTEKVPQSSLTSSVGSHTLAGMSTLSKEGSTSPFTPRYSAGAGFGPRPTTAGQVNVTVATETHIDTASISDMEDEKRNKWSDTKNGGSSSDEDLELQSVPARQTVQ